MNELPIHALRERFDAAFAEGPVVLTSPTGSGKSTEVPRWCPGPVLVVEPRRIACRSLAVRVAEQVGTPLGEGVGYIVRDERVARDDTRVVFATPGIVLRHRALLARARTVILDEFHERSLDLDLLLALLLASGRRDLVVMSATLDGPRIATHVGGTHLAAEGRAFPVEVRHVAFTEMLPDPDGLVDRVERALEVARADPGDVLVFLPGKAEIEACAVALQRSAGGRDLAVVQLHGGLGLDEQRRAFEATRRRKVILATNVAETSLTIPGVGVVIDGGLVRQTRYHDGRGHLSLVAVAADSAAQRAGRAGRTGPGVCYRLWSPAARLEPSTPPEIHRESLVPLVMAASAWGETTETLPFLDPPRGHAVAAARVELEAWGALAGRGALSEGGAALFALPLDPAHARVLIAARTEGCLEEAIDLLAALSLGKPLFSSPEGPEPGSDDDLRAAGCDLSALVRAVRAERPSDHGIPRHLHQEARTARTRLRRLEGLPDTPPRSAAFDREALVRCAVAADPRCVHVARTRGREVAFSNGGTELRLARESAVHRLRAVDGLVVMDTRAFGRGRDHQVLITCGAPISTATMARFGLGEDRVSAARVEGPRVVSVIERVLAGRVLAEREETPVGPAARTAFELLLGRGSLFARAVSTSRQRLERRALAARLAARGHAAGLPSDVPVPSLEAWLRARIDALGIAHGDDLAMLSAADFLAPELPVEVEMALDREFPAEVHVGDATYRAEYDLEHGEVVLRMVKGSRKEPPPLAYLPRFTGLRVCVEGARGRAVLRERGR